MKTVHVVVTSEESWTYLIGVFTDIDVANTVAERYGAAVFSVDVNRCPPNTKSIGTSFCCYTRGNWEQNKDQWWSEDSRE